jgi:hypothetical protein
MAKYVHDRVAGARLRSIALLEIRAMARRRKPMEYWPDDDYVACIAWLADLCHNMPSGLSRETMISKLTRPRGSKKRLFFHAWRVADERGRKWIVEKLEGEGLKWNPPNG